MNHGVIYLDHAAATPLDEAVVTAMQPYFVEYFHNPSAEYLAARKVRTDVEGARSNVARILGVRPTEVTFTAGGTEANNMAIHGVMNKFPGSNIIISSVEHESITEPAKNFDNKILPVHENGRIDIEKLRELIDEKTVLVSVMYANNEIGTVQPLRGIAKLLDAIRRERKSASNDTPIYFHTDACQAANYLDIHVERLGVDMMTLNGGKIYGPKQSGILYISSKIQLEPILKGGGQERNLRSGTENVPSIIGFSTALTKAQKKRQAETKRLQEIQKAAIKEIQKSIPNAIINGSLKHRLPNNIHVTFPAQDNERLIFALDEVNIQVAAGSACSASSDEPSHVLSALGISDEDARASLRISMGRTTSMENMDTVIGVLEKLTS